MSSLETAELLHKMTMLLKWALEKEDQALIKQYDCGLRFAKNEHIKALEHDLIEAHLQLKERKAA